MDARDLTGKALIDDYVNSYRERRRVEEETQKELQSSFAAELITYLRENFPLWNTTLEPFASPREYDLQLNMLLIDIDAPELELAPFYIYMKNCGPDEMPEIQFCMGAWRNDINHLEEFFTGCRSAFANPRNACGF